jgi:hypothetical protein
MLRYQTQRHLTNTIAHTSIQHRNIAILHQDSTMSDKALPCCTSTLINSTLPKHHMTIPLHRLAFQYRRGMQPNDASPLLYQTQHHVTVRYQNPTKPSITSPRQDPTRPDITSLFQNATSRTSLCITNTPSNVTTSHIANTERYCTLQPQPTPRRHKTPRDPTSLRYAKAT